MIQGTIETIAFGGQGILRHEGFVLFVPFTAPGDRVTVEVTRKKKQHGFAKLLSVDHPSALRTTPLCPYFGTCGGCQFQHMTYTTQLEIKRTFIQDALQRIGKHKLTVPPIVPAEHPWNYRRHIRLQLQDNQAGYIGVDHATFLPVNQCPIFVNAEDPLLSQLNQFLRSFATLDKASVKLFKQPNNQTLLVFTFDHPFPEQAPSLAKTALAQFPNWAGILLQSPMKTVCVGHTECTTHILGLSMEYSPFGFIQNYPEQSEKLYRTLIDSLPSAATTVLDLFCGIGTTALLCAQKGCRVIGVESHEDTVQLATHNAKNNGLKQVEFICGKAEKIAQEILEKMQPDVVLCNPPRTGLDPLLTQTLIRARPQHLAYVSCMPATLARDLGPFIEAGYTIDQIQGFDMFPQTTHVETFVKLSLSI